MTDAGFLRDPLLEELTIAHGFGQRGSVAPEGVVRPRQVHGTRVARADSTTALSAEDADAVVSLVAGLPIAIVTADCVPILLASSSGRAVAAVHAGWRGLAAGVVTAAARRLAELSGETLVAAIGPHIRSCCYEVDAPVIDAMKARFGDSTQESLTRSRPGHEWIALERLITIDLERSGIALARLSTSQAHCTACDADRFESFRRDGPQAGRLLHWVAAMSLPA